MDKIYIQYGTERHGAETPGAEIPDAETIGAETPDAETISAETWHFEQFFHSIAGTSRAAAFVLINAIKNV